MTANSEPARSEFNDLRGAVARDIHRDDAVVIAGAEYLYLRLRLQTAHELVCQLGSRWREGDMKGAGEVLARLEDAVGLSEQGESWI